MSDTNLPKIEITNLRGEIISLGNYDFQNFRYQEDVNLGFPIIEFSLQDNLYQLLKERLYGEETLKITEFIDGDFQILNKEFTIKSLGSAGKGSKISSIQSLKLLAIDKVYDNIIKTSQSTYFKPNEKKIITDLIKKYLIENNIIESNSFKINIPVPTKPFKNTNLYIPYSKDVMKIFRRLANYSISTDGRGGYVFFINRDGFYFIPIYKLFESGNELNYEANKDDPTFPFLRITEENQIYRFKSVKLSTFNSFANFLTGHEKRIYGFNPSQGDYNIIKYGTDAQYTEYNEYSESGETTSQIKLEGNRIPFLKDFSKGNITSYYTPLDNIDNLKGFGDTLYFSQMFNYQLDIEMQAMRSMQNFKVGQVINCEFSATGTDRWDSLSGGWLLKTFDYIFPGNAISLSLTRMGTGGGKGNLPDEHYTIIGS